MADNKNQMVFNNVTPELKNIIDRASYRAYSDENILPRAWRQRYFHDRFMDLAQWEMNGFDPQKAPRWLPQYLLKYLDSVEIEQ